MIISSFSNRQVKILTGVRAEVLGRARLGWETSEKRSGWQRSQWSSEPIFMNQVGKMAPTNKRFLEFLRTTASAWYQTTVLVHVSLSLAG